MAAALASEGSTASAVAMLIDAPTHLRIDADLGLLEIGDDSMITGAARRLATQAPHRLRAHSRSLESSAVAVLDDGERLTRAAAWRAAGLGSRGAAELRRRRFRGSLETARRLELARCELDAGSTARALSALPSIETSDADAMVLRAEAHRRRGWSRMPDPAAQRSFATCLGIARVATTVSDRSNDAALALVLECATEAGELEQALAAWHRLEAARWTDPRRGWLGRRLGVALARAGAERRVIGGLSAALPQHARCFEFWAAFTRSDTRALAALASVPIPDLYGLWSARRIGTDTDRRYLPPGSVEAAAPWPTVAWLLQHADTVDASQEWQRLLDRRRPAAPEALAAAELAALAGHANTAIRNLRAAYPQLGSTGIAEVPANAAAAYLPLRWEGPIRSAATESGLEPWLIAAIARQESTFVAHARSSAGAVGVLQLLPSTARGHSRPLGLGSLPDLTDPEVNIRLGSRELAWLIRRYGSLEPAIAAYNAGDRRVQRWWQRWPTPEAFTEAIPIPETYTYVRRVMFLSEAYREVHARAWEEIP
jgi:soluble lytic murein transglycosylase